MNIFLNILRALSRVYFGGLQNVGSRIFSIRPLYKQVLFKNETSIDPNFTTIFTCSFYNFKYFDFFSGDDCGSCCGGSSTPPAPVFQTYASTLSGADRDNSCSSCDSCEEEDNSHKPVSRKAHQVCFN